MFKMLLARAREARAGELGGESGLEGGFTLIELMVVLLIIAILLAIAIPTFLSVSGGARDRAAQSNATNGVTDLIAYYQNAQTFAPSAGTLATAMTTAEPSFTWSVGGTACTSSNYQRCISVQNYDISSAGDGQAVVIAVLSGNGNNCWFVANLQQSGATSFTPDASGTPFEGTGASTTQEYNPGSGAVALTSAGTYYSMQSGHACEASYPSTTGTIATPWVWYPSYSAAQTNPG